MTACSTRCRSGRLAAWVTLALALLALLATACAGDGARPDAADGPLATAAATLDCHVRKYTYKVVQEDAAGRQCWDHVGVNACWGRCDSREISDWRFPFKRSFHPVCMHAAREPSTAVLRHCDAAAEPGTERYDFQQALSCRCAVCKSSEASCESARFRGAARTRAGRSAP